MSILYGDVVVVRATGRYSYRIVCNMIIIFLYPIFCIGSPRFQANPYRVHIEQQQQMRS